MNILNELFVKIENHTESCRKRFISIQKREMEVLASENDGLFPHVDPLGRLHAAKDGFCDESGKFYVKGQYIPMPELPDECFYIIPSFKNSFDRRIQIIDEMIPAFEEFISEQEKLQESEQLKTVKFGLGKQFEKKGVNTCYLYIKAVTKGFLNIAFDCISDLVKKQQEIIEANTPKKEKGVAPEGKQVIIGTILGLPWVENYYGMQQKVFIELENNATIYGSLPGKLCDAEIGDKVQFSANFTHADEDNTHAFFKRPTKPQFIKE